MKVDKQNGNVCYNDEEHIYWNEKDNGKYISVTTLIGKYEQPYDKEFWSAYKALEKLLSPEAWKIEKPKLLDTYKFDKSVLDMYDISENDLMKHNKIFQMNGIKLIENLVREEQLFILRWKI